jgi:putative transposase
MRCMACGSTAVSERPECTVQGYRRFRCRACGKQFNERSTGSLNRTQYPSDVIALVVLWRLRYKLSLRDLPEMFLIRGIVFSHEAVREWEAKLTPALERDDFRSAHIRYPAWMKWFRHSAEAIAFRICLRASQTASRLRPAASRCSAPGF